MRNLKLDRWSIGYAQVALLLLSLIPAAWGANVQSVAGNQGGSGGTYTLTVASTTAGDRGVFAFQTAGGFAGTPACSDNAAGGSSTWTLLQQDTGAISPSGLCYCENLKAGVTAVSVTNGGKVTAIFVEENGLATGTALDQNGMNAEQSATTTPTVNVTTTASPEVAYSFFFDGGGAPTYTAGGTATALSGTGLTGGNNTTAPAGTGSYGQRAPLASSGSYTATATSSVSVTGQTAYVVTLKQSGGAVRSNQSMSLLGVGS